MRRVIQRVHGHFLKAEAIDVEFSEKLVEVSQVDASGTKHNFYLPYDKLVVGVGMLEVLVVSHNVALLTLLFSQVAKQTHMASRDSNTATS